MSIEGYSREEEIFDEEYERATRKIVYQDIYTYLNRLDHKTLLNVSKYHDILDAIKQKKANANSDVVLITINPKPEVPFRAFQRKINKAFSKRWIPWYVYAYEQRSSDFTDNYYGFHVHAIIPTAKMPSDIKREFRSTFKDQCDVYNDHCLNFKFRKFEAVHNFVRYIKKHANDDTPKGINDAEFRFKENLEDWYEKGKCPIEVEEEKEITVEDPIVVDDLDDVME